MSESDPPTVRAGRTVEPEWPPSAVALVDRERCPSCFTNITSTVCATCGLDLRMPRLAEVLESGHRILRLVSERSTLVSEIRAEQAERESRAAAEAAQARRLAARESAAATRERLDAERARAATAAATGAASAGVRTTQARAPHRSLADRFSLQFTILGVGVLLTSIGAVVFLFWAYLVVGLEVRSLIIAGASIAVLALAWFLRGRGLVLTGEAVGVVAVVLLMLDAWIIRANDAFGAGAIEPLAYYGSAALLLAGLLAAARLLTGLRVAGYAAAGLTPTGIALLSAALVPDHGSTRWWVAGIAALALATVAARALPASHPGTVMLGLCGLIGLAAVIAAPDALPDMPWHALVTLGAAALVWGALAVSVRTGRIEARMRTVVAAVAGVAAAGAPVVAAGQELSTRDAWWVGPAGAAVVTCVVAALATRPVWLVLFAARPADPRPADGPDAGLPLRRRIASQSATVTAAAVAALASLVGLLAGLVRVASVPSRVTSGWHAPGAPLAPGVFDPIFDGPSAAAAPLAVAVAAAALLAALGLLRAGVAAPVAAAAWAAIVTGTYPAPASAATIFGVIAAAALALAAVVRSRSVTVVLTVTVSVAGALLLCLAYTSVELWMPATAGLLAIAVAGAVGSHRIWRDERAGSTARAFHLAIASTVACASAAVVPAWAAASRIPLASPWSSPWMWAALGAAAVLTAVCALRRLSFADTWSASGPALAAALAALAGIIGAPASLIWIGPLALTVVGGIGVALDRRIAFRACLAVLTPLAAGVTAWNALPLLAIDHGYRWVGVAAAALVLAGAGLLIRLPKGASAAVAWFSSIALVATAAVAGAAGTDQLWLALGIVAPIPYVMAAATGEPTASRSAWRHLAWLTPPLALAALWTALHQGGAQVVEAYTLPAAALLLGIAVLLAFRRPLPGGDAQASRPTAASGRAAIVWAGAATTVLPTVAASMEPALRPILAVCAGVILLALSPWCVSAWRGVPVRLVVIASGGAAAAGAAVVRGAALAARGDWSADLWAAVALAACLAAAALLERTTATADVAAAGWTTANAKVVAGWTAAAALALGAIPVVVLSLQAQLPVWMLIAPVVAFAVLQVATALPRLAPLCELAPRSTAVVVLALVGAATIANPGMDPFDAVTVLVGASLLAAGIIGARRILAWAGAAAAIGPSVAAAGHPALRPLIVVAVAVALLATSRWIPRTRGAVPLRTIAIATGAAGAIGAAGVRGLAVALDPGLAHAEPWGGIPWAAGVWSTIALAGGLIAALLMQRLTSAPGLVSASIASSAIAVAAVPVIALELGAAQPMPAPLLPVLAFAGLQVAVTIARSRPWSHPLVVGTSIVAMIVVAAVALLSGQVDPFDLVTAAVAAALLVGGALRMTRNPTLRSWSALGPGLAVLLIPSLLADYTDPVSWRLVTVGVVALAVMVAGIGLRLQAPFVMGAGVLIVHGLTQLWPVIAENYAKVWWWLWLAVAGVILIAIAATYERQLRFAKTMFRSVASLR
jgi:hypothetical protein